MGIPVCATTCQENWELAAEKLEQVYFGEAWVVAAREGRTLNSDDLRQLQRTNGNLLPRRRAPVDESGYMEQQQQQFRTKVALLHLDTAIQKAQDSMAAGPTAAAAGSAVEEEAAAAVASLVRQGMLQVQGDAGACLGFLAALSELLGRTGSPISSLSVMLEEADVLREAGHAFRPLATWHGHPPALPSRLLPFAFPLCPFWRPFACPVVPSLAALPQPSRSELAAIAGRCTLAYRAVAIA